MRRVPVVNERLKRRDGEGERAHRAFLLWAMQAPDARNGRAVARAVKSADNAVRKWRKVWMWDFRTEDPTSDTQAGALYSALYHRVTGGAEVTLVADWMAFEYAPPGIAADTGVEYRNLDPVSDDRTQLAKAVDAHLENDRRIAETEDQKRRRRLETLLDVSETRLINDFVADQNRKPQCPKCGKPGPVCSDHPGVAAVLPEERVKVRVADLPHIIRGRAYLAATRAPATSGKANAGADVARSRRVEHMIEQGYEPSVALKAEYEELGLIIDTLRDHAEGSNVVRFPAPHPKPEESTGG